jgi:hypothetical protein
MEQAIVFLLQTIISHNPHVERAKRAQELINAIINESDRLQIARRHNIEAADEYSLALLEAVEHARREPEESWNYILGKDPSFGGQDAPKAGAGVATRMATSGQDVYTACAVVAAKPWSLK